MAEGVKFAYAAFDALRLLIRDERAIVGEQARSSLDRIEARVAAALAELVCYDVVADNALFMRDLDERFPGDDDTEADTR